jgi:hypothetical protein
LNHLTHVDRKTTFPQFRTGACARTGPLLPGLYSKDTSGKRKT